MATNSSRSSNDNYNSMGAPFYIGRVKSIVLNQFVNNKRKPNPDYKSAADIGKIRFDRLYSSNTMTATGTQNDFAYPMFSFIKQFPVVNEIVAIFYGPSDGLNDSKDSQKLFYMPAYAMWNAINHNAMPNPLEYSNFLAEFSTKPEYQGSTVQAPEMPKGFTFTESPGIRSLTPFEGDSIIESRYGQSIRFGSTVTDFKGFNPWSDVGENGSPITIIRNGQGRLTDPLDPFSTTVENINSDGASIYLTTTQRIVIDDLNKFPLNTYGRSVASTAIAKTVAIFEKPVSNDYSSAADQDTKTFS
jgi:hypothetical protein